MALELKNLSYTYSDNSIVSFPNFEATSNSPLLILGASGSGKTTLLQLLAGFLVPTTGVLSFSGNILHTMTEKQRDQFRAERMGVIFQDNFFVESLTISENIRLQMAASNKPFSKGKIEDTCEELGIKDILNKKPATLSRGQLQRAQIMRALAHEPQIILADEPTSSLDDENAKIFMSLLEKQVIRKNKWLVMITHDNRIKNQFDQVLRL